MSVPSVLVRAVGDRKKLHACMTSKATAAKLRADIEFAESYNIQGTPLLLVNGRHSPALGPVMLAMVLAGGDFDAPGFAKLPPARKQDHTGHGH